ncbi:MAG TPA: formate--phosphoribosylaminoimidazolecarboxamide ligase [Candidatus Saccharimonadales bacterium]
MNKPRIMTLGSHSALQILKGAKDEGFETIVVVKKEYEKTYRAFPVADEIITIDNYGEYRDLEQKLIEKDAILIPHGSLFAAITTDELKDNKVMYFGEKEVLALEESRKRQRQWLLDAGLTMPKIYDSPEAIDGPAIVKFNGAGGGKGYFLAKNKAEFDEKIEARHPGSYIIQQYVIGNPIYVHYFHSPLTGELEIMSMDKRYETNVDSIGRISAKDQLDLDLQTSYNIIGNMPLVVRESMLARLLEMGESVVAESKKVTGKGLFGPFCLEMVITPDMGYYVFEISARIVAGSNPYVSGSPYSDLRYDVPMSTGRRIAREIKTAYEQDRLDEVIT